MATNAKNVYTPTSGESKLSTTDDGYILYTDGEVVRLMKYSVSREAGFPVWQKGFYDHVIRNDNDYREVWNYIEGNPGRWAEDKLNV